MDDRKASALSLSVDTEAEHRSTQSWQAMINRQIGVAILDLAHHCAFEHEVSIYEVRHKQIDDGWLTTMKGRRHGKYVIAFVGAGSFTESLELTAEFAAQGVLDWRPDRYPPTARK